MVEIPHPPLKVYNKNKGWGLVPPKAGKQFLKNLRNLIAEYYSSA